MCTGPVVAGGRIIGTLALSGHSARTRGRLSFASVPAARHGAAITRRATEPRIRLLRTAGIDHDLSDYTSANPLELPEDGSNDEDNYAYLWLESEPTADVTVTVTSSDATALKVGGDSFGASVETTVYRDAWDEESTDGYFELEVVADDDTVDDTVTLSFSVTSDDANYNGLTVPDVTVIVTEVETGPTVPTVSITGVPSSINTTTAFTATFTWSEAVTGFTAADVTVRGGTAGTFSGNGSSYTLDVTPSGQADVTVEVAAGAASNAGGNTGPASAVSATAAWDATAPTVAIGGVPLTINTTDAFTATFTWSEDVTGFTAADVTVTGGAKGTFSGDGSSYTLDVTPSGQADVVVEVTANEVLDHAGNTGPASAVRATAAWDATTPTVTITGVPSWINTADAFTATFTWSEAVTGFTAADVTVTGGTEGTFSGNGSSYTLEVTPSGQADVTVEVAAGAASNAGGNTGPASAVRATAVWDDTAPTLTGLSMPSRITTTAAFTATFRWSEDVTGFTADDVTVTGGGKGAFTRVNGSTYTLLVTPAGSVNVVVEVAANAVSDEAGNTGPSSPLSKGAVWDTTAPTVEITGVPAAINTTDAFTATFTFSERVIGFTADDVTVTGGTAGMFSGDTGDLTYTLEVTPDGQADVAVEVVANSAEDLAGNTGPSSSATATATWDAAAPTVEVGGVPAKINTTTALSVTFTWSEDVTGFTAADVTVTGGSASAFGGNGKDYTLTVTPDGSVNVVVSVTANSATDGVGNRGPSSSESATAVWDTAPPTVEISGVPSKINTTTAFRATFTWSEDVTGFTAADVTVTGGTAGTFSGSGSSYELEVTPSGQADVVVEVVANAASDEAGNTGPSSSEVATATWDAAAPAVAIGGVPSAINTTTALSVTFTWSEDVTGFTADDVTVTGGSASGFGGNGKDYTLTVTPVGSANVVVSVTANSATDDAGNTGPASSESTTAVWDTAPPTVEISGVPLRINTTTAFTATFTFSEDVTGFTADDVTVTGGTEGMFSAVNGSAYTLLVTPAGMADVTVEVVANAASDGVGNTGPASAVIATATWDTDPPTLAITEVPSAINSTAEFTATFTFSKAVTGFEKSDVSVTGGLGGTFTAVNDSSYTLEVTPAGMADVTVEVVANAAADRAGNTGPASAVSATAAWDATAPTLLEISGVPSWINTTTAFRAAFTFSEDVTGFTAADVTVTGGTEGVFSAVTGSSYTLWVTPDGMADVTVEVVANAASDDAGNTGPASVMSTTALWDDTAPTVEISEVPSWVNTQTAFTARFEFSEAVAGFDAGDVTVTGGTAGMFSGDTGDSSYELEVTPSGQADVTVTVTANTATDRAGNTGPLSSESATAMWDATAPTVEITGVPSAINTTDPLSVTLTWSEDVTGFDAGDVTVTGGTEGTFAGNGKDYTLEVTPSGSANVVVTVTANAAMDEAGNTGPTSPEVATAAWDAAAPTVEITGVPSKINATTALSVTFAWSEDVTEFTAGDVTVTGGTEGTFSGSGSSYELEVTPSGSANVVVSVTANSATDGVGNTGPASAESATAIWDATAPTVAITGVPPKINTTDAFTATFTWSEDVTGFVTGDVTVTGGMKGAFTAVNESLYRLEVTPTSGSDVVVTVVQGAAIDGVNAGPATSETATATWDGAAPTVEIGGVPSKINTTAALSVTFTWSEDVTEFTAADVTVTGGTAGTFSGNGKDYTLAVTPTSGSNVTVTVTANSAADEAGNTGPASSETATATWDATAPTVTIGGVPSAINTTTALSVTFTWSEDVTGFTAADVTVTGGAAGTFAAVNDSSYTLTVTPTSGSNVTVTVTANSAADEAGNTGPASSESATATWDGAAPTVTIGGVPPKINTTTALSVTFTWSEDVTGFTAADVTVTGGSASGFAGNGRDYTLTVMPTSGSDVVVTVVQGAATDGVNMGPASAVIATATWDAAAPTVEITGVPSKINTTTALSVTFTWSEDVTGFTAADVTVAGGSASAFGGNGKDYTLTVTPTSGSNVVVTVTANSATDGVNMGPSSEVTATATWDAAAPTVTIGGVPSKINTTTALNVTFTWSEDVTGFTAADVAVTGGTKGTFGGNGKDYTLTVTPTSGSNVVVTVTANSATDGVNMGPSSEVSATATWDAAAPTVTTGGVPSKINTTTALGVTFTWSEDVTEFTAADVTVTGGTAGTFAGNGKDYTLTVTPSGQADVVVSVAANSATDGVNRGPASSATATATWDGAAPTVEIGGVPSKINATTALGVTFTWSEDVTGFVTGDVTVTGGMKGTFTVVNDSSYTLLVTPTGQADVVVEVAANSATDGVNRGPASSATATATWDGAAPTVAIGGVPSAINTTTALGVTFTWSEDVTEFTAADVTVTGGTAGTFAGNGKDYTLTVTPTGGSDVVVSVAQGAATDGVNRGPSSSATATATWDGAAPTVEIGGVPSKINATTALGVTFTWSEDVTGFTAADVTVTGGTAGTFSGTGSSYELLVTPSGQADVVVEVVANAATDEAGNTGPSSSATATATWDGATPAVEIGGVPSKINTTTALSVTFTWSEDVTGFTAADVTVTGGTAGTFAVVNDSSYTLGVTPTSGSDVTVSVTANSATDGVNTGPSSSATATATWDGTAPTVTIGGVPSKINATTALSVTFTWSEDVTGFTAADVTVTGGTKGTFGGNGRDYTLTVMPTSGSDIVVTVVQGAATDGVNMGPASAVSATATWDATAPTVEITGVPSKINTTTALSVTFTWSEDVTGFTAADVTVAGGSASAFGGNGKDYTLTVTPTSGSNVVVSVTANSATDGVNMGPASAVSATATWDGAAPTVTIGGVPSKINTTTALSVTFTWSEDVTGFTAADVTVTGGTEGTFAGNGKDYTLTVTPIGGSNVVVSVVQGAATDGVNAGPASAEVATATWDAAVPTVSIGVPAAINTTDAFTATFTWSEDVSEFVTGDVAVTGGTKGAFAGGGKDYTLEVMPTSGSDVVVTVTARSATDGVNAGPASVMSATTAWDTAAPTLTISGVPPRINSTTALTVTFTFSEDVTEFASDDVTVTGGTEGTFTAVNDSSYTLEVTPASGSDVTVSVAQGAATDRAGNISPPSAVSATATWDAAAPAVTITGVPAEVVAGADFTATFTFSEAVTGFEKSDVTVTHGTAGTFSGSEGDSTYTLAVTVAGTGDVTVTVAANAASDSATNAGPVSDVSGTAANPVRVMVVPDTLRIGENTFDENDEYRVGLSRVPSSGTVTVAIASGDAAAVAVAPPGSADWVASGELEFTPSQWRPQTVQVLGREDENAVGETVTIEHTVTSTTDTNYNNVTAPSVVVQVADNDTAAVRVSLTEISIDEGRTDRYRMSLNTEPVAPVTVTITSPDPAVTVAVDDSTYASSAILEFTAEDYATWKPVTVRAVEDGNGDDETVTLAHAVSGSSLDYDRATVPAVVVRVSDTTAPTPEIGVPAGINSTADFTASFEFSEPVTGFETSDVTVTGGVKGTFSGGGSSYTLVVTPSGPADVTVEVAADAASDGSGITGPPSAVSATVPWDVTAPTVEIIVPRQVVAGTDFTASFEFSEAVTGFTADDVTVTGGAKGAFEGSGTRYTLVVMPAGTGNVTVEVAASAAQDGASNAGPASAVSATVPRDMTAPTVEIDVPARINSTTPFTAHFEFSEAMTGFAVEDVTVTGGTAGAFSGSDGDSSYTLAVTPTGAADVTVEVAAAAAADGAGNAGPVSVVSATVLWDATPPTLEIAVPSEIGSADFTASFTFSEPVTGFAVDDVTVTGGTAGMFAGSGSHYTLVVTPAGIASVTVEVGADAVADGAGNAGPVSAARATAARDVTAPTVQIGVPSEVVAGAEFTASFTFSEAVTEFDADDVTVTGGTKGTFAGRGPSYTLVVTPAGAADVTVEVAADAATDGAGNTGPESTVSATALKDATAPTLEIVLPSGINSADDFTASFEFSEAVTGFDANDVMVTGGTKGAFKGSGSSYTLVVAPAGAGDVTVEVAADAAADGAGNAGPASDVSVTAAWDTTAPALEIVVPSAIRSTDDFTASFEFSEAVTGFDADDVTVTGGAKGAFEGSGSSYTMVVAPTGAAGVTVEVAAHAAEDGAGNTGPASAMRATALGEAVTPAIGGMPPEVIAGVDFTASFEFSGAVTGFETSDVTVTGGTKGTFSGSGSSYTLVVTPAGAVDVTVEVAAHAVADGAGNTGPAMAVRATAAKDTTAPALEIGGVPSAIRSAADFTASFEFSEAVTGFVASDVAVTGGTKGAFSGSGSSYSLAVKPAGARDVTVTVAAHAVEDGAANAGPASAVRATAGWDTTAPTVEIGGVPSEVVSGFDFAASFEFSEAVTGFAASDVTVTGGAKGAFSGSGSSYTLVVTPAGTADVALTVAARAAADGAGNRGPPSAVRAMALKDTTAPTVEIGGVPSEVVSGFDFTARFEFSEAVTGFAADDVTVTGGAKGAFSGSGSSYTLVVTSAGTEDVTVTVAANAAADGGGNTSPASAVSATALKDTTAPMLEIRVPSAIRSTTSFTVSFEFSEAVTGFDADDVTVTGGAKGVFRGSDGDLGYTLEVTPAGTTDVTVEVAANAAADGAGNAGPASAATATAAWDAAAPTLEIGMPSMVSAGFDFAASFEFSEAVTGFDADDVTVMGGTKGTFSGADGDSIYTLVVTPVGTGDVTVAVAADAAVDRAKNSGPASEVRATVLNPVRVTVVPDTLRVTENAVGEYRVGLSRVPSSGTVTVTVTSGDPTVVAVLDRGWAASRVLEFTPSEWRPQTVQVLARGDEDSIGETVTMEHTVTSTTDARYRDVAASFAVVEVADDAAAIIVSDTEIPVDEGRTAGYYVSLSAEPVAPVAVTVASLDSAVTVAVGDGAHASTAVLQFTSTNYSIRQYVAVRAAEDSDRDDETVTLTHVASGSSLDYDGVTGPDVVVKVTDVASPTLEIGVPSGINSAADFTASFEFPEAVTGFTADDVTVTAGTKGAFEGTGSSYTLEVTPSGTSDVTVEVTAEAAVDGAGKAGPASAVRATAAWDTAAPTLEIGVPPEIGSADFTVSFAFSEPVTGFDADDVTVTGGTRGAFSGSDSVYALVVTPSGTSDVTVEVAAEAAADGAGNEGPAAAVRAMAAKGYSEAEREQRSALLRVALSDLNRGVSAGVEDVMATRFGASATAPVAANDVTIGGQPFRSDGGAGNLLGAAAELLIRRWHPGTAGFTPPTALSRTPSVSGDRQPFSRAESRSGTAQLDALASGTSFRFGADDGGGLTLWGKVRTMRLSGEQVADSPTQSIVDGGYAGADYTIGNTTFGFAVSRHWSEAGFTGQLGGGHKFNSTLTSVSPYVRVSPWRGASIWTTAGIGRGKVAAEPGVEADISTKFAAAGMLTDLTRAGPLVFSLKSNASVVGTRTHDASGVDDLEVWTRHGRLALGTRAELDLSRSSRFVPSVEVGARLESDTVHAGAGMDLGSGLRFTNRKLGIDVVASGRWLVAHEVRGIKESAASLQFQIGRDRDRGLSLSLEPSWGGYDLLQPNRISGSSSTANRLSSTANTLFTPMHRGTVADRTVHELRPGRVAMNASYAIPALGRASLALVDRSGARSVAADVLFSPQDAVWGARVGLLAPPGEAVQNLLGVDFNAKKGNLAGRPLTLSAFAEWAVAAPDAVPHRIRFGARMTTLASSELPDDDVSRRCPDGACRGRSAARNGLSLTLSGEYVSRSTAPPERRVLLQINLPLGGS